MTEDATTRRTRSEIGATVVLGVAMDKIAADRAKFQTFLWTFSCPCGGLSLPVTRKKIHAQR
jgi:hypothetical protein